MSDFLRYLFDEVSADSTKARKFIVFGLGIMAFIFPFFLATYFFSRQEFLQLDIASKVLLSIGQSLPANIACLFISVNTLKPKPPTEHPPKDEFTPYNILIYAFGFSLFYGYLVLLITYWNDHSITSFRNIYYTFSGITALLSFVPNRRKMSKSSTVENEGSNDPTHISSGI